jgi:hypothetical protein
MFIGHFALGLAAKRLAPRTSLATLFIAPTLADLLWPVFLLLGWEQAHVAPDPNPFLTLWLDHYPISHSLVTLIGWGALFALLYRARTGLGRAAAILALLVVSHWVLDVITHRPDLPIYPGGPEVGLGLWRSVVGTLVVEGLLFGAGIGIYIQATRARDKIGRFGFWAIMAVLAVSYVSTLFSPPPPDMKTAAVFTIVVSWVFVIVAWWVDRHREAALHDGV